MKEPDQWLILFRWPTRAKIKNFLLPKTNCVAIGGTGVASRVFHFAKHGLAQGFAGGPKVGGQGFI